jgi:hypothetical protein
VAADAHRRRKTTMQHFEDIFQLLFSETDALIAAKIWNVLWTQMDRLVNSNFIVRKWAYWEVLAKFSIVAQRVHSRIENFWHGIQLCYRAPIELSWANFLFLWNKVLGVFVGILLLWIVNFNRRNAFFIELIWFAKYPSEVESKLMIMTYKGLDMNRSATVLNVINTYVIERSNQKMISWLL